MKNKILFSRSFSYFLSIIVFKLLLDFVYKSILCNVFAYENYHDNSSAYLSILSWIILLIFTFLAKKYFHNKKERLSNEILFLLFLLYVVPFSTMIKFGYPDGKFIIANFIFLFLLFIFPRLNLGKQSYKQNYTMNEIENNTASLSIDLICVVCCFVIIFISGIYTGFRFNFNFSKVYELRSEASGYSMPTIVVYLYSWTRGIMTVLIAYYMRRRKYIIVGFCILMQLLSFGIDGQRTVFFYILIAVGANLMPKFESEKINIIIAWFMSFICILSLSLFYLIGNITISSLFVRRMLFSPQILSNCYFDFFLSHEPDFYRGSLLKYIGFSTPYPQLPHIIASTYFNSPDTNSNNGLISDAVANMGLMGILVFPIIMFLTLKLLDKASERLDMRVTVVVSLYATLTFMNSFFVTGMVTHGILIIMVLLFLMKKKGSIKCNYTVASQLC